MQQRLKDKYWTPSDSENWPMTKNLWRSSKIENSSQVQRFCNEKGLFAKEKKLRPWSLGGQDGSWHHWNWCQYAKKCILSLFWKLHSFLTCLTLSRLTMSSKSDLESWMTGSSGHEEWHLGSLLKVYYVTGIFWCNFQAFRSLQSLDIVFT